MSAGRISTGRVVLLGITLLVGSLPASAEQRQPMGTGTTLPSDAKCEVISVGWCECKHGGKTYDCMSGCRKGCKEKKSAASSGAVRPGLLEGPAGRVLAPDAVVAPVCRPGGDGTRGVIQGPGLVEDRARAIDRFVGRGGLATVDNEATAPSGWSWKKTSGNTATLVPSGRNRAMPLAGPTDYECGCSGGSGSCGLVVSGDVLLCQNSSSCSSCRLTPRPGQPNFGQRAYVPRWDASQMIVATDRGSSIPGASVAGDRLRTEAGYELRAIPGGGVAVVPKDGSARTARAISQSSTHLFCVCKGTAGRCRAEIDNGPDGGTGRCVSNGCTGGPCTWELIKTGSDSSSRYEIDPGIGSSEPYDPLKKRLGLPGPGPILMDPGRTTTAPTYGCDPRTNRCRCDNEKENDCNLMVEAACDRSRDDFSCSADGRFCFCQRRPDGDPGDDPFSDPFGGGITPQ